MSIELRRHERFDAREGATAAIVTPDDHQYYVSIGQIDDISMGGLALHHDVKPGSFEGVMDLEIEIFGYSGQHMKMYVGRLPVKVVYDKVVATDERRSLDTRRVGLEFNDVPYYRLHKLGNFVQVFTKMKEDRENEG